MEDFWTTENDDRSSKNEDLDTESDNETDSDINNDTYDYESDEEINFDDNYDTIENVTISANRGMRLIDKVKEEFAHSYFQVSINGDKKYLHKQAACWLLEKDRSTLSSDRLSRVQGK